MDPSHGFLGLDCVVRRLIAEDGFHDTDLARRSIAEYERFFLLAARQRAGPLVPSRRVDLVWQRHMLDTPAYAKDCARWAGAYLHRDDRAPPGDYERTLGLLGPGDPEAWDGPGPASASADVPALTSRAGSPGDLDREDFSAVLARVRYALRSKPSASPWVADARELLETDPEVATEEYRRFLALLMAGAGRIAPCKLVDEFWHQHILDSRNYARFCARVAGRYLHHTPHYGEPHAFHEPAFRRTLGLYRARWGCDPPGRIWAHLGESGGGGGDGCSSSGPAPLYAVDTPQHMCAGLRIGRVAPGFRPLHPVLVKKGLPPDLWAIFLRALDAVPRIPWAEFNAIQQNSLFAWARNMLVVEGMILSIILYIYSQLMPPKSMDGLLCGLVGAGGFALFWGLVDYAGRWTGRPFREESIDQLLSKYRPDFLRHDVHLDYTAGTAHVFVEASFTDEDMRRMREEEELRREERRRDREEARRRRRGERDAYYLDRGIKPGLMAWYRALPEWCQATLLGLVLGLIMTILGGVGWWLGSSCKWDGRLTGGRIVVLVVAVLSPSVLAALAFRLLDRTRERGRRERETATEMGIPIPAPVPSPARPALVCIATGAGMPFGIVYLAWLTRLAVSPSSVSRWIPVAALALGTIVPFFTCIGFVGAVFGHRRKVKATA